MSEFCRDQQQKLPVQELGDLIDKAEASGVSEKDFSQAIAEARLDRIRQNGRG